MTRRGIREQSVVELARSLFYDRAMVQFEGEYVGAVAAISKSAKGHHHDLNYGEIFIRDNVPVMVYLLLEGKYATVRHFLDTCLRLQGQQFETRGIFPTSFVEHNGILVADYGQRAIGRVVSVDATLWWPILTHWYVQWSGDRAYACSSAIQTGIQQFLELILRPHFRAAPTLYVPDGAFMIDRPLDVWGAPLEIQTLLYGALLSAAGLIRQDLAEKGYHGNPADFPTPPLSESFTERQIHQFRLCLEWIHRLRCYLLRHYWVNSKTVQVLRRRPTEEYGDEAMNIYNIQTETIPHWLQDWLGNRGGYLIGNIRTGRPDFRFFTLGNCLGAIFDVLSPNQQRALFHLIARNQRDLVAHMPLRICHPPLDDSDWRNKTGYDRKNLPWCYHNAGHWPCLLWFLVAAVLRHQYVHSSTTAEADIKELIQHSYKLMLQQLPRQQWAEYFDGPMGTWMGQQARGYQTWTIVGFLLVHHFLKVNPTNVQILNLPTLQSLTSTEPTYSHSNQAVALA